MKTYGLDYVAGTGAKKIEYEDYDEYVEKRKVRKTENVQNTGIKLSLQQKTKLIICLVTIFSMFMLIVYRYNKISEANLKVIELKAELENVSSNLSLAMMKVEQGTNLIEIEAYAKQKLGMQKPSKNQIVYVDTSTVEKIEVQNTAKKGSNILDSIKKFFCKE